MMSDSPKPINLLKTEYKLLGKIGSGGFSFVYLVESISNGVLRAAKEGTSQSKSLKFGHRNIFLADENTYSLS